jgi:hypothetical protein
MAKMRRTKSEEEANFSEDFFRMEEISCENEQEDSAKNPLEKESTKRVSRGQQKASRTI